MPLVHGHFFASKFQVEDLGEFVDSCGFYAGNLHLVFLFKFIELMQLFSYYFTMQPSWFWPWEIRNACVAWRNITIISHRGWGKRFHIMKQTHAIVLVNAITRTGGMFFGH